MRLIPRPWRTPPAGVQFWYALAVMVLVPLLLIGNTWFLLRAVNRDVHFVLRRESGLVQTALEPFLPALLPDPPVLRERLTLLKKRAPEIRSATVLTPDTPGTFIPLATTADDPTLVVTSPVNAIVLATGESHAALVLDRQTGGRAWSVVAPVRDGGRVVALTNFSIATDDVDVILRRTTRDSLVALVATVVIVLLLLLNHLRFFESARLYQRLREVDQMKDDFFSMAAHELRTPVTTIRGYAELVRDAVRAQPSGSHAGEKEAGILLHQSKSLSDLVDDLLDVSRLQQGRLQFDIQPMSLQDVVRAVVDGLAASAHEKGLALQYAPPAAPLRVRADRDRLRQVFTNLIGNAVKYTERGSVTVRHEVRGKSVATTITDTGIGMTPEEREHLFEKFYRIRDERTRTVRGTGLGLWITKQIVENLGGKIYVDSLHGQGSQLTVLLPLLAEPS